jgi:hypothetical protein
MNSKSGKNVGEEAVQKSKRAADVPYFIAKRLSGLPLVVESYNIRNRVHRDELRDLNALISIFPRPPSEEDTKNQNGGGTGKRWGSSLRGIGGKFNIFSKS